MIKLIVTDLDGTFLREGKTYSEYFWDILEKLREKNIYFCVCTGRQMANTKRLFNYSEKIIYACNNGSQLDIFGEEMFSTMNKHHLKQAIDLIHELGFELIAETKKGAIIESSHSKEIIQEIEMYCDNIQVIEDLNMYQKDICKLTISCFENADQKIKLFEKISEYFNVTVSGDKWIDIMNKSCNKKMAVEIIQQQLNITSQETLVFGDYINDLEMMKSNVNTYACKNAHRLILDIAKHIIPYTNDEDGVLKIIESIIKEAR